MPTAVRAEGAELRGVAFPAGEPWTAAPGGGEVAVYRGRVEITGELRPTGGEPALLVTWQPCDDARCLPPVTRLLGFPR